MTDISQKQGGWTPKENAERLREMHKQVAKTATAWNRARANPSTDQGGE